MGKTFSIISLGCFRNSYDSEIIAFGFSKQGYKFLPLSSLSIDKKTKIKPIDLLIINTCGFIDKAKEESVKIISVALDLKKKGRVKKLMVIGCLVKRYQERLEKAYPSVDFWQSVVEFRQDCVKRDNLFSLPEIGFLKICEGCLNRCSFCAIPLIKGPLKSKFKNEVLKEVKDLERRGVRELNIIGQDITSWGKDLKTKDDLASLLKEILKATKEIKWIRLIYTHPKHFNDSLIDIIAKDKRICKYIDLPIQHINDKILKKMNRGTTKQDIVELIKKIRKSIPGCAIRTSVIVGFPGESEEQFQELLTFLKQVEFQRLGVFIYSREEGTKAFNFPGQVHFSTKQRRFRQIMVQQKKISQKLNSRFVGKDINVLVECKESGMFIGRTEHDALDVDGEVFIKRKGLKLGNFYKVKITEAMEYDLIAE